MAASALSDVSHTSAFCGHLVPDAHPSGVMNTPSIGCRQYDVDEIETSSQWRIANHA